MRNGTGYVFKTIRVDCLIQSINPLRRTWWSRDWNSEMSGRPSRRLVPIGAHPGTVCECGSAFERTCGVLTARSLLSRVLGLVTRRMFIYILLAEGNCLWAMNMGIATFPSLSWTVTLQLVMVWARLIINAMQLKKLYSAFIPKNVLSSRRLGDLIDSG